MSGFCSKCNVVLKETLFQHMTRLRHRCQACNHQVTTKNVAREKDWKCGCRCHVDGVPSPSYQCD